MALDLADADRQIPRISDGNHTMGASIKAYVEQRLHQDIVGRPWKTIHVRGSPLRPPRATLSNWERDRHKGPYNYRRPTTTVTDSDTIELHCFPSPSFVHHYASLIVTYLRWQHPGGHETNVTIDTQCMPTLHRTLQQSNLSRCPVSDVVIMGEVHQLMGSGSQVEPLDKLGDWETHAASSAEDDLFAWTTCRARDGTRVTLLGCREGLWGEAAGAVLRSLVDIAKARCFIYVGKAGALSAGYAPNETIVTGATAFLERPGPRSEAQTEPEPFSWKNPLSAAIPAVETDVRIATGAVVTVSTPLCETTEWLSEWRAKGDWVDCETAHMALEAKELGVEFGFLHVVSDNLESQERDNLSNEELDAVRQERRGLYRLIATIIHRFLEPPT